MAQCNQLTGYQPWLLSNRDWGPAHRAGATLPALFQALNVLAAWPPLNAIGIRRRWRDASRARVCRATSQGQGTSSLRHCRRCVGNGTRGRRIALR
jgi:hypothetical protein